jgi:hypothetical protein
MRNAAVLTLVVLLLASSGCSEDASYAIATAHPSRSRILALSDEDAFTSVRDDYRAAAGTRRRSSTSQLQRGSA